MSGDHNRNDFAEGGPVLGVGGQPVAGDGGLHLPAGAAASRRRPPVDRSALEDLLADVAKLQTNVMLPLDVHSLLALFAAAHLGIRHPALAGSSTADAVVALTDHIAAELVADDETLEPLARLLRAGLDPTQDR